MPDPEGVNTEDSPTRTQDVASGSSPDPKPVTADPGTAPERTAENMFRELQRKQDDQARQTQQILQYLTATAKPEPAAGAAPRPQDLTDDDLWTRAQAGDREAFVLHQQRITDRRLAQTQYAQNRQSIVDNQLRALFLRYPVLRDPSHELTKIVNQAYALYVQNGYPADKSTMLSAATAAITDNPELIASMQPGGPARDASRSSTLRQSQSGATGVSHRNAPAVPGTRKLTVSDAEIALAKRMGVKDPLKAKENFLRRNQSGESSLGAVGAFVDPENF